MKKLLFISLLFLVGFGGFGQGAFSKSYDILSNSRFNATAFTIPSLDNGYLMSIFNSNDAPYIKTDSLGNIDWAYRYGFGSGTAEIGSSLVSQSPDSGYVIPGGYSDSLGTYAYACLIKVDKNGNPQWSKIYGDSSMYSFGLLSVPVSNGYVVCSFYYDTLTFEEGVLLIKTDLSGTLIWARKILMPGSWLQHITKTNDGGVVVVATEGVDLLLFKVDSSGNLVWANKYLSFNGAEGLFVTTNNAGDILVTGRTMSWGNMDDWDAYLMSFDANGVFQWGKTYGNASMPDEGYSVSQVQDGGYVICAEVESFYNGVSQTALIKTDSVGNLQWMKLIRPDFTGSFPFNAIQNSDGSFTIAAIDGDFVALDNVILIHTDQNLITNCPELPVTPFVANIPSLNSISIGTVDSTFGETSISTIDNPLSIIVTDLCEPEGIWELEDKVSYQIYPNPTTGKFTLQGASGEIQVYDLFGRLLLRSNKKEIDMSSYPAGLYIWNIGTARGKLILE